MAEWIPVTEVVKQACTFERNRLGEPRTIPPEAFDRWLAKVKAEAVAAYITDPRIRDARTVTTVEEAIAIPVGAILLGRTGNDWRRTVDGYVSTVGGLYRPLDSIIVGSAFIIDEAPATVLYTPEGSN